MVQYNPYKPIDWVTPLEKVYDRQSKQLDRYHEQLRERDRQEEAATLDVPEMFAKLASFSQTIGSVVKARKAEQQETDWSEVKSVFNTASSMQELRTISEDYKLKKKGLLDNWEGYEKLIRESTKLTEEQKSYALEKSPRRQLRLKEVLGQSVASNLEADYQSHFTNMSAEKQVEFENLDSIGKKDYRRQWSNERLSPYGYQDGFILENVKPELDRFLGTKNKLTEIKAKNLKFTEEQAFFETAGDQFNLTGTPEQIGDHHRAYIVKHSALNSDPNSESTPTQQGVEKWVSTQSKILRKGEDSLGDLQKILTSQVKHKGHVTKDNPEGWTTFEKAFLNDDIVAKLTKDANTGVNTKWEREKASTEFSQKSFIQQTQAGKINKEQWLEEIDRLEKLPNANKDLIKELKELDPDFQNAAVEATLTKEWDVYIENGFYGKTEEDIEAIPNYNVKKKAREKWAQLQKAEVKHGTSKGDMDQTVHRSRTAIPWANKESMDPTGKLIARELDIAGEQYRAGLVYDQYKTGTYIPDPEIATKTNLFKKALWESRGGGKTGGDGRYSVDVMEGSFKNFQIASRMRIRANDSHNLKYTVENGDAWAAGIQTKINSYPKLPDGNFDYQGFIESGLAYSKQDLIGTITNGSYSEKMQYIADYLNTDVETLFESSLKEANKDKDFARRWSFDKLEKPIDTQIREDLDRAFKRFEGDPTKAYQLKDLKYLMKKGWKNLSNNQKSRVYATLVANSSLSEEAGADADEARKSFDRTATINAITEARKKQTELNESRGITETQQKLTDLGIGFDPEKFNLEWDETNKEWKIRIKE